MLFISNPSSNTSIYLYQTITIMDDDDDVLTTIIISVTVRCSHEYILIYCCYCCNCYISYCCCYSYCNHNNFLEWIFDCFNCGSSYMWTSISTCVMSLLTVSMCAWIVVVFNDIVHYYNW